MDPKALSLQGLQLPLALPVEAVQAEAITRLLALVGQELDLRVLSTGPQGTVLQTPSGSLIQAEGEIPFPRDTQIKVQVQGEAQTRPRLRLLEAVPPQDPELLAPLVQGEAQTLMARLNAPDVPQVLEPLLRLFRSLQEPVAETVPPRQGGEEAVRRLPEALLRGTASALGIPEATPPVERRLLVGSWIRSQAGGQVPDLPQLHRIIKTLIDRPAFEKANPAAVQAARDALDLWGKEVLVPPRSSLEGLLPADRVLLEAFFERPQPPSPVSARPASTEAPLGQAVVDPAQPGPVFRSDLTLPASLPARLPEPALRLLAQVLGFGEPVEPPREVSPRPWMAQASPVPTLPKGILAQVPEALLRDLLPELGLPVPEEPTQLRGALEQGLREVALKPGDGFARTVQLALARLPEMPVPARNALLVAGELIDRSRKPPPSSTAVEARPQARPEPIGPSVAARPETWEQWIRSSTQVLGDPVASPVEAPFHLAQAREGTALFEIPLPWAPQSPLQIWVEGDAEGSQGPTLGDNEKRVLLSFTFSHTGQTRVGLAQSPSGLRVRIWAEHPALVQQREEVIRKELEELGRPVDLKVMPLGPQSPDLRTVARGRGLELLG